MVCVLVKIIHYAIILNDKIMKIYSVGTAALDIFFIFDNINFFKNLKEKNDVNEYFVDIGGGGLNFAYNFQKLGLDSIAVVKIGNDFIGRIIKDKIKEKKIKAQIVTTKGDSSFSFIFLNKINGKKYIFTYRGDEIFKINDIPINSKNSYYISTGKTPVNTWKKIIIELKNHNNYLGINPSKYFLNNLKSVNYLRGIDFLNINFEEALIILKKNKKNKIEFLKNFRDYLNFIDYILITDSNHGAWLITKNKIYHSNVYRGVRIIDTTGAGDSFGSTIFAYLIKFKFKEDEEKLKLALKYATFTTIYNLTKIGAQTGILSISQLNKMKNKKLKIITYSL